ncbi:anthranilate phosphoribosyltransferase, partial [Candidatus Aerophobetes bacterium]|nr:anthranilate phosphoribosyltransferase [Candidatus Aerophobetes bacterium]
QPEDFGIKRACLDEIRGGTRQENARILKDILEGAKGPKREIVLINAAACLVAADLAKDLEQGIQIAANSIDSGRAKKKLEALIDFTRN